MPTPTPTLPQFLFLVLVLTSAFTPPTSNVFLIYKKARGLHTLRNVAITTSKATSAAGFALRRNSKIFEFTATPFVRHLSISGPAFARGERRQRARPARGASKPTEDEDAAASKYDSWGSSSSNERASPASASQFSSSSPSSPGPKQEQELYSENDDEFTKKRKKFQQELHEQEVAERMAAVSANSGHTGETQIDALRDRPTRQHVAKVMSTAGSGIALATASSAVAITTGLAWALPMGGLIPILGSFVPMMLLMKSSPQTHSPTYRNALFGTFVGLQGWGMAPLLGGMFAVNPMAIPLALGGTTAIFAVTAGAALMAPRGALLKYGTVLGGACIAIMVASISNIFIGSSLLQSGILGGALLLFSGFIAYDTQEIVERFRAGDRDHLTGAVNIFIDLIQMFKMLMIMFGMDSDD